MDIRYQTQSTAAIAMNVWQANMWTGWEDATGGGGVELMAMVANYGEKSGKVAELLHTLPLYAPPHVHLYAVDEEFGKWLGAEIMRGDFDDNASCKKLLELLIELSSSGGCAIPESMMEEIHKIVMEPNDVF